MAFFNIPITKIFINKLAEEDFVMNQDNHPRALNEKAAAQYIGMSVSYLRKDRMDGLVGQRTPCPQYAELGKRVIYLRDDLDSWLEQHIVQRRLDD